MPALLQISMMQHFHDMGNIYCLSALRLTASCRQLLSSRSANHAQCRIIRDSG